jgi:hypothetical protein
MDLMDPRSDQTEARGNWKRGWPAAAALVAVALFTWRPAEITDGWMYAATGRWIVENRAVPYQDSMTWTFSGRSWQSNGWLFGVLLWALMTAGGLFLYALVKPIATVLMGLAVRWTALAYGASRTAAAGGMVIGPLCMAVFILERPQLATFVFTPIALGLTRRSLQDHRLHWRRAAVVPVAFALWANFHSGAIFGALLVGAAAAGLLLHERFWRDRNAVVRAAQAVGLAIAALLATLLTPYGWSLWTWSNHVRDVSTNWASEWRPLWQQQTDVALLSFLAIAVIVGLAIRWGAHRRLDIAVPLGLSVVLALQAFRNVPAMILIAASLLPAVFPSEAEVVIRSRRDLRTAGALALLAVGAVVGVPGAVASRDPGPTMPIAPVAALPGGCRLASDIGVSNWALWERPDVPVSADGRNDLYGRDIAPVYWFKTEGDQSVVLDVFQDNGVSCVMAKPGSPLIPALTESGWSVVAEDSNAVTLLPGAQSSR